MALVQSIFGSFNDLVFLALLASLPLALYLSTKRKKRVSPVEVLGDRPFRAIAPSEDIPEDLPVEHEDPDLVERVAVSRLVADLMMADEWVEVGTQIAEWEDRLAAAPGGARFHDVASDTALSGLQSLIDAAPHDALENLGEAEIEVGHFINTHERNPECHVLAALAARAHLALGEACRADHWPDALRKDAWRRMAHHFLAAGEILKDFDPLAYMSPLLAEAHYMHALGSPGGMQQLPFLFEAWIDLDPSNPSIYERHAEQLADPEVVSDDTILNEAEKALERTESTLGAGGYALFFLPLLELRDGARSLLDADLFATAMLDLASLEASQAEVNQTANALAAEMRMSGNTCDAMNDTLYLLIRWHMNVIYPRLWTLPEDSIQSLVRDAAEAVPDIGAMPANTSEPTLSRAA